MISGIVGNSHNNISNGQNKGEWSSLFEYNVVRNVIRIYIPLTRWITPHYFTTPFDHYSCRPLNCFMHSLNCSWNYLLNGGQCNDLLLDLPRFHRGMEWKGTFNQGNSFNPHFNKLSNDNITLEESNLCRWKMASRRKWRWSIDDFQQTDLSQASVQSILLIDGYGNCESCFLWKLLLKL